MSEDNELSFSELQNKRGRSTVPIDDFPPEEEPHAQHREDPRERHSRQDDYQEEEPRYEQGTWNRRRVPWEDQEAAWRRALPYAEEAPPEPEKKPMRVWFDWVRLIDVLVNKWKTWLVAGLLLSLYGAYFGYTHTTANVSIQLIRREVPNLFNNAAGDLSKPQQFSEQTLFAMVKSPEVLRRVAQLAKPPITPGKLSYSLIAASEPGSELVTLTLNAKMKPQDMVNLINLYAEELVQYSKDIQVRDARELQAFLSKQLEGIMRNLETCNKEMESFAPEEKFVNPERQTEALVMRVSDLDAKILVLQSDIQAQEENIKSLQQEVILHNPVADKLRLAKERLDTALAKYTEAHPEVVNARSEIAALEKQLETGKSNTGTTTGSSPMLDAINLNIQKAQSQKVSLERQLRGYTDLKQKLEDKVLGMSNKSLNYAMVKNRYQLLENMANALSSKKREAQSFEENALGYYKSFSVATLDRVGKKSPWTKPVVFGIIFMIVGMIGTSGFIAVKEIADDRLRTAADVARVTEMPVLGTLGDLDKMTPAEQAQWAFRTWTIIKGKLTASQNEGIVCGFISAHHGEGRSTWIKLLVKTANMRGLRVLTIATKPTDTAPVHPHEAADEGKTEMPVPLSRKIPAGESTAETEKGIVKLPFNVLATPSQVTEHLTAPNSLPVVHIPLPGWVWNLERRTQWQEAMEAWGKIDNLVLLVELPPASEPESVLLAEKLPQVIWLADSGRVTAKETKLHLETLRHANCNIVGAVLNHEPVSHFRRQLSRWFHVAMIGTALFGTSLQAATNPDAAITNPAEERAGADHSNSATNLSFAVNGRQRAPWQKRLTLGPGDVLNLGFYGETNLAKTDIAVGPDGRLSYLQVRDVKAAGLTVDELREKLNEGLKSFYRNPQVIVTPVSFRSKKYVIMGKVVKKGVYILDRPITVLEALARANGFETGLLDRNTIDMADLQRSFLVRRGQRIPLNFEKLFQEGDLTQNIAIEPDDYLFFPASSLREIYVVGEVRTPGAVTFTADMSVAAAIAERGGFNDRAWKSRVVVVRGSLNKPEAFAVDMLAIQDARRTDFKLQPKDIVYVSYRPFIKVEELLDVAATGFIQAATASWTGLNVGPIIREPFIPNIESQD